MATEEQITRLHEIGRSIISTHPPSPARTKLMVMLDNLSTQSEVAVAEALRVYGAPRQSAPSGRIITPDTAAEARARNRKPLPEPVAKSNFSDETF